MSWKIIPNAHHGYVWGTENVETLHAIYNAGKCIFECKVKVSSQRHVTVRLKNEKCFSNV